jgi:hypothetical protein
MAQQYSTTTLRSAWEDYRCKHGGTWTDAQMWGKGIGGVPLVTLGAYQALQMALTDAGYHPPDKAKSVWSYNCRLIAGTSSYSLHSYGTAIDIDPVQNPHAYGDAYNGWMKKSHVDAVMKIKTTKGKGLWYWGGYWSKPDRMHFQIDNLPSDCEPDWSTVPGYEKDEDMPLNDADLAKIRGIVKEEIAAVLDKDDDKTSAVSRTVWQHGGVFSGSGDDADDNAQRTLVRVDQNTK